LLGRIANNFILSMKKQWFALQVHTGREKWIASYLTSLQFEHVLLLQKESHQWSDRRKSIEYPVFPGYLFCHFAIDARGPILSTPGVLRVVGYGKIPVPVPDEEIASLQMLKAADHPLQRWPFIQPGDLMRIEGGALDGLVGSFVEHCKRCRIVISVTLLQRSVAVEVDGLCVTPVAKAVDHKPRQHGDVRAGTWEGKAKPATRDALQEFLVNAR
jgi:transcription antitermination factor NusG